MEAQGSLSELQQDRIRAKIPEGETLLWVGQEPSQRFWLRMVLRLVLCGFWVFLAGALTLRWFALPLFLRRDLKATMLPELSLMVLTGLGIFLLSREVLHLRHRQPELYALTPRRALVLPSEGHIRALCLDQETTRSIHIRRHWDGSGDITFMHLRQWATDPEGRSRREAYIVAFYGVPRVDEILCILEAWQRPELPDIRLR
jgi:hypothetical protein